MKQAIFSTGLRRCLLAGLLSLGGWTLAYAQGPGSNGPTPPGAGPTAVPLDGGASLLLAAGVGLGWRLRRGRRAGS